MKTPRSLNLRMYLTFLALALFGVTDNAGSEVVIATETARGEYENGVFTPDKPEFRFRFDIDEVAGRARLTELTRLKNDAIVEQPVDYVITMDAGGDALTSFLVSENRRGQRIITLVGKPGALATEVILLGEDFFEYCKASSGRLYLSTGIVKRSISVGEDASRQVREATEKKNKGKSSRP